MTVEAKRERIHEWCENRFTCDNCPINKTPVQDELCYAYNEYNAPEEVIDKWYDTIMEQTEGQEVQVETPAPTILDSGDRTEFSTGAVRDLSEGKGRMDLIPWLAIMEVSKHCENGAKKYGEHNVDKGIPVHSFIDSAFRHLAKHTEGWEDEPHLIAAAWNVLWAIQTAIKRPELNDIPWKEQDQCTDTPTETNF